MFFSLSQNLTNFFPPQFAYFFENEPLPEIAHSHQGTTAETSMEMQSKNLLLDNVSKIERKSPASCLSSE